jgi:hypothetical protein
MRTLDDVWRCYTRYRTPGVNGGYIGDCLGCGVRVAGLTYRLRRHADACASLKQKGLWGLMAKQPTIIIGGRTKREDNAVLMQLAKVFYSLNIPFMGIENKELRVLMNMVAPGLQVMGRRCLAGTYLNKVYTAVKEDAQLSHSGKWAAVSLDAWTTSKNESLVASTIEDTLLDVYEASGESHTGKFYRDRIADAVFKYGPNQFLGNCCFLHCRVQSEYAVRVAAVVTDNASNCALGRSLLAEEGPSYFLYGCQAHILNLLAKDLAPARVLDPVIGVLAKIKNSTIMSGLLRVTCYRC